MGVSISNHVYDRARLTADIEAYVAKNGGYRENAISAAEFVEKVGGAFGILTDSTLVILWNEYYQEYNNGTNFLHAVDRYYFPDHEALGEASEGGYWDTFWSSAYDSQETGGDSEDVLESLFPTEFGYEGKFAHDEEH